MGDKAVRRPFWRRWWPWAIVLAVSVALGVFGWQQGAHRGRIAPGVRAMGVDLGGLTAEQARARLQAAVARAQLATVALKLPSGDVLTLSLAQLGMRVDLAAVVRQALASGRVRLAGLSIYVGGGRTLPLVVRVRPGIYLEGLGPVRDQVDVPPHSATLRLDGRRVEVEPAVEGRTVDDIALERAILASLAAGRQFDAAVPLAAVAPAVTDAEAQAMAGAARVYLSRPIVLRLRSHTVTLTPTQMAPLLAVNTGPTAAELPLTFNNPRAIAFLHRAFRFAEYPARDATIAIRGKQAVIVPSRQGQAIDVQGLTSDMDQAASSAGGLRTLTVQLTALYPRVTTDALQQLGLSGLGSEFTTYYDPSNAARAANIALCAKLVDGTVIPAGHVFSLNDTVGPRTLNRGFDYAPVIVNGVLMQGVGGGLCQFATTLFNAAFFAGLPIVERHPHQFAIEHYPLGRDASVAWGAQDLRFRNTTGHALMIRAWASKSSLTIVIVGATGRTVTYDTGPMRNVRQPSCGQRNPRVVYDDTISAGISRLEPGAPGYTISVTRTVSSNGRLLFRDTFTSTYQPKDWIKRIGTRTR